MGTQAGTVRGEYKKRPKKPFIEMSLAEFLITIKKTTRHPRSKETAQEWRKVIDYFVEHINKEFKDVKPQVKK